jgi:AraC-like DNA-binding protein
MEKQVLDNIKQAADFEERISLLNNYYTSIVKKFEGSVLPITIVSEILDDCSRTMAFNGPIEEMAAKYSISSRTLQRYFEKCTSLSTKKTLQILRIRKAVEQMALDPAHFDFTQYGYYDYSHFYKHLQQFLDKTVLQKILKNAREVS